MSAIQLNPVITDVGLQASHDQHENGLKINVTEVALGDGNGAGYAPDKDATGLVNERCRVSFGGGEFENGLLTLQSHFSNSPEFWVREVGFYLDDGTLFAVWSDADSPLMYKTATGDVVVAFVLRIQGVPEDSINVVVSGPAVNIIFDAEFELITANQARLMRQQWNMNEAFYKNHGHYPGEVQ